MTLIAVSQRTDHIADYHETRDALDQRWTNFFSMCEVTPVLVPNHLHTANNLISQLSIDGILLTGGNDADARHEVEKALIKLAIKKQIPLLGVCHGMQMIQRYFGVQLYQVSGHVTEYQVITINGEREQVNSYHDTGTTASTDELMVWARADDGVVKAVCHRDLPIIGIMWHPERFNPFQDGDVGLVRQLFINKQIDMLRGQMCEPSF